ncbi:MAG: glycine betaine ABC transporter substrate-binding protein [Desulfotomaculaceae bacterium]|nr:glycine betaine ABC transporter substrate-binding protein [Desulfotomaculaceae bacterium]
MPKLPLGLWVEQIVDWAQVNLEGLFDLVTRIIGILVTGIETVFLALHPLIIIALIFILVWFITNRKIAIGTAIGLYFIYNMEDPKEIYGAEEFIHTIVRKGLKEEKPEVYDILDKFNWTASDMEAVMLDITDGMDPAEAAAKWVEANQEKVKEWIAE